MSGEPMPLKVINEINEKIKFLYRKIKFLTPELCRMLCNARIQPYFTTRVQLGTKILPKNKKEDTNYAK